MFTEKQQAAFRAASEAMRKAGGSLTQKQIEEEAHAVLHRCAQNWTPLKRRSTAKVIAATIYDKFDATKVRQPKEPRRVKANRKAEIVRYFYSTEDTKSRGVRSIARKFNISPSTAHQIMKEEGLIAPSMKLNSKLSPTASHLIALIENEIPNRNYRLLDSFEVQQMLGCDEAELLRAMAEISAIRQPVTIIHTEIPNGKINRGHWLVAQRGKTKGVDYLRRWAAGTAERLAKSGKSRVDQRLILSLRDMPLPRNAVLRDVGAVRLICDGSTVLRTWRFYLRATLSLYSDASNILAAPVVNDYEGILNGLNGAIRINKIDDLLLAIPGWLTDPIDRSAAQFAFELAGELRESYFDKPMEAVNYWMLKTQYRERVAAGLLPGRSTIDVDMLSTYADLTDGDELYSMFVASSDLPVTPIFLNPRGPVVLANEDHYWVPCDDEEGEELDEEDIQDDELDGFIMPPEEDH